MRSKRKDTKFFNFKFKKALKAERQRETYKNRNKNKQNRTREKSTKRLTRNKQTKKQIHTNVNDEKLKKSFRFSLFSWINFVFVKKNKILLMKTEK